MEGDKGPPVTEVFSTWVSTDLDGLCYFVVYYSRAETWRKKAPLFHLRTELWSNQVLAGLGTHMFHSQWGGLSHSQGHSCFLVAAGMLDVVPGPLYCTYIHWSRCGKMDLGSTSYDDHFLQPSWGKTALVHLFVPRLLYIICILVKNGEIIKIMLSQVHT